MCGVKPYMLSRSLSPTLGRESRLEIKALTLCWADKLQKLCTPKILFSANVDAGDFPKSFLGTDQKRCSKVHPSATTSMTDMLLHCFFMHIAETED